MERRKELGKEEKAGEEGIKKEGRGKREISNRGRKRIPEEDWQ